MLLNKKNILLIIFSIAILAVFTGIVCADESGDSSFFSLSLKVRPLNLKKFKMY